jgi:hypothetical protein
MVLDRLGMSASDPYLRGLTTGSDVFWPHEFFASYSPALRHVHPCPCFAECRADHDKPPAATYHGAQRLNEPRNPNSGSECPLRAGAIVCEEVIWRRVLHLLFE